MTWSLAAIQAERKTLQQQDPRPGSLPGIYADDLLSRSTGSGCRALLCHHQRGGNDIDDIRSYRWRQAHLQGGIVFGHAPGSIAE